MKKSMMFDLHLHTTASDGTEAPSAIPGKAMERGISLIAITDHDTVGGIEEAKRALLLGQRLIPGIEISAMYRGDEEFKCHILGLGIDPTSPSVSEAVDKAVKLRRKKLERRFDYIRRDFGIVMPKESVERLSELKNVGKLHIAGELVRIGAFGGVREAMDRILSLPGVPEGGLDVREAVDAILGAGGVPIWAHPLGGEGEKHISEELLRGRVKKMKAIGIVGLECYYSRYSEEEEQMLLRIAAEEGLSVSGGSDYHGENKTVSLGTLCSDGSGREIALLRGAFLEKAYEL